VKFQRLFNRIEFPTIAMLLTAFVLVLPAFTLARTLDYGSIVYMFLDNTTNKEVFYNAEFHEAHRYRKGGILKPGEGVLLIKRNAIRSAPREVLVYLDGRRHMARLKWYQDVVDEQEARFFNRWAIEMRNGSLDLVYKSGNTD
jgi:hypothetical protein